MELLFEFWNKLKSGIKVLLNYLYIILGMGVFFTLGYYYNTLKELSKLGKPEFITREEVTVAIDENNNFMIIDKTKGTYIILEDQIGTVIFNVYAKTFGDSTTLPRNEFKTNIQDRCLFDCYWNLGIGLSPSRARKQNF